MNIHLEAQLRAVANKIEQAVRSLDNVKPSDLGDSYYFVANASAKALGAVDDFRAATKTLKQ